MTNDFSVSTQTLTFLHSHTGRALGKFVSTTLTIISSLLAQSATVGVSGMEFFPAWVVSTVIEVDFLLSFNSRQVMSWFREQLQPQVRLRSVAIKPLYASIEIPQLHTV